MDSVSRASRTPSLTLFFDEVVFVHVPRDKKSLADAIATLASIVEMPLYRSMALLKSYSQTST